MSDSATTHEPAATIVAEIGSITTRVTLIDTVAGEARMIGQAELPSTLNAPYNNALLAVLSAIAQIGDTTGRKLLEDGQLLMPQTAERDGVDAFLAFTSAAGPMGVVIAAIASDISAQSALRASRATYTLPLQVITLNDTAHTERPHDLSWIERQVQTLLGLRPDLVVVAGGLEQGADDALVRLAHIVGLTALTTRVDGQGQQRHDITMRPVIFAGNSHSRERVIESLSGRAETFVVDNVRPSMEVERLEPARSKITQLYNERMLPRLPGMADLRRLSKAPVRTACEATGLMTRFVAQREQRTTLTLDAGASSTAAYYASQQRYSPVVLGGIGVGYGLGSVLAERGIAAIMRWLPFPISEQDLTHHLLNKLLRPQLVPSSFEDLLIEQAVAREALSLALEALWDEVRNPAYNLVIAGGSVLTRVGHPGLAALTILDVLQQKPVERQEALDLHLDALGLMGVCGTLAHVDPDAALTLFERDLLQNTPLATCIIAQGEGRAGETALEAELAVVGGTETQISVPHGQIARLPLLPGQRARLVIKPASNVRVGRNAPGKEVSTDLAAIGGSALGVVIDARGCPLQLPEDSLARQTALWEWMVALGAAEGPLPYERAAPLPDVEVTPASSATRAEQNGAQEAPTPPAPAAAAPGEGASLEDDLASLRQKVETPKRGGFFRRR